METAFCNENEVLRCPLGFRPEGFGEIVAKCVMGITLGVRVPLGTCSQSGAQEEVAF